MHILSDLIFVNWSEHARTNNNLYNKIFKYRLKEVILLSRQSGPQ